MTTLPVIGGDGNPYQLGMAQPGGVGTTLFSQQVPSDNTGAAYTRTNPLLVNSDGGQPTFTFQSVSAAPAATPTDVFTITGSATKIVRLRRFWMSGQASTAGLLNPFLIERSTANTGGASSVPVPLARDGNDGASTVTLALYTANPATLGTVVGTWRFARCFLPLVTVQPQELLISWSAFNDKAPTLRGITQVLALNFAGAAVPASGQIEFGFEWTETAT